MKTFRLIFRPGTWKRFKGSKALVCQCQSKKYSLNMKGKLCLTVKWMEVRGQGVFVLFINNLPTEWEEKTVGIYTTSRQILKCDVIQMEKRCKNSRLYPTFNNMPIAHLIKEEMSSHANCRSNYEGFFLYKPNEFNLRIYWSFRAK